MKWVYTLFADCNLEKKVTKTLHYISALMAHHHKEKLYIMKNCALERRSTFQGKHLVGGSTNNAVIVRQY